MLLEKVWLLSEIEMLVSKQERIVAKVAVFLFFYKVSIWVQMQDES